MHRRPPPPSPVQYLIRRAWADRARQADLEPVAAWWRWRALETGHAVFWLKQPWHGEEQAHG